MPTLDIARFPGADEVGAASVSAAVADLTSKAAADRATYLSLAPMSDAPVWVTIDEDTYVVHPLNGGGWFASAATLAECSSIDDMR